MSIYKIAKDRGLHPKHAVEVGVWFPSLSQCIPFLNDGCRVQLFEPLDEAITRIKEYELSPTCELHEVGIYDFDGEVTLVVPQRKKGNPCATASSYIEGVNSPHVMNGRGNELKRQTIQVRTFDHYDDGSIDVLALDCEGCEWFVLNRMISRPKLITVEMHHKKYRNPFELEIKNWMQDNDYVELAKHTADIIYIKEGY